MPKGGIEQALQAAFLCGFDRPASCPSPQSSPQGARPDSCPQWTAHQVKRCVGRFGAVETFRCSLQASQRHQGPLQVISIGTLVRVPQEVSERSECIARAAVEFSRRRFVFVAMEIVTLGHRALFHRGRRAARAAGVVRGAHRLGHSPACPVDHQAAVSVSFTMPRQSRKPAANEWSIRQRTALVSNWLSCSVNGEPVRMLTSPQSIMSGLATR